MLQYPAEFRFTHFSSFPSLSLFSAHEETAETDWSRCVPKLSKYCNRETQNCGTESIENYCSVAAVELPFKAL